MMGEEMHKRIKGIVAVLAVTFSMGLIGTLEARPGRPIFPAPFSASNQKVELADGELYVLCGEVIERAGVAALKVDLRFHPWLSSAKRIANPYYDLAIDPLLAQELFGKRVQIFAHAKGRVIAIQPGLLDYILVLDPIENGVSRIGPQECPAPKN